MTALPLLSRFEPEAPLAWHRGAPVTQGAYLAHVADVAARLPDARYALNVCESRYRFMVAFAAVCLRGQTNLLPAAAGPAAQSDARAAYPNSYVLDDTAVGDPGPARATSCPTLPGEHLAALLFTSGSTGTPQAHGKRWRTLCAIGCHLPERLLAASRASVVATVPPQHMYGLETSVLSAYGTGLAVHGARPLFPADIADALGQMPAPRMLVTTPVHLRALAADGTRLPGLSLIVSATAPLSAELARRCEEALGAPVHEIYGCTEAGSMATRRTLDGEAWTLLPGMRLHFDHDAASVSADHFAESVPLQDRLEDLGGARFRLLGRSADLLKVAGKRVSLNDLTQKLLAVPGVQDAVIFNAADGEAARPAALVVAPGISEAAILEALAQRVDAVFLPRPLRKVEKLPRNALGKLPRQALLELLK